MYEVAMVVVEEQKNHSQEHDPMSNTSNAVAD